MSWRRPRVRRWGAVRGWWPEQGWQSSHISLFRAEQGHLQAYQKFDEQHGEDDDGEDRCVHLGVLGDRLVVGYDVADAGRRDQQLGENDADEARGAAEAQSGEDDRRRRRQHDLQDRSEEHTSELQSLMSISYAVFCLTKKTQI